MCFTIPKPGFGKGAQTVKNRVFGGEEDLKKWGGKARSAEKKVRSWREAPKRKWGVKADTERVVKTIRKVEPRFASFNEVKESKGARDRSQQEIFLHENKVALEKLPLDELFDAWSQSHLPSLKKNDARYDGKAKSVETFLKKDCTSLKFMETWMVELWTIIKKSKQSVFHVVIIMQENLWKNEEIWKSWTR